MGFGYLLLGYLVTFLLQLTAQGLGMGGIALVLGYALMFYGLWQLTRFERSFAVAKWMLVPLFVIALYATLKDFAVLFLWELPFVTPVLDAVVMWTEFALVFAFNLSMLLAIRAIAKQVELLRTERAAIRNAIFVGIYVILFLVGNLPLSNLEVVRTYLKLPVALLQLVWILCNLFLLLSCTKDICKAGDENIEPKRYKWEFLNKIGDAYEANRQRSIERTTRETEERLRRRNAEREKKKIHHKKKKH